MMFSDHSESSDSSKSPMSMSPAREMIWSSSSFSSSIFDGDPSSRDTALLFLGKAMTSLMVSLFSRIAHSLSIPMAIPPWGCAP